MFVSGGHQTGALRALGDIHAFDTHSGVWMHAEQQLPGRLPSPRNAAVLVPLRASSEGGPASSGAAAGRQRFFVFGGWQPFVESYSDSIVLEFGVPPA